MVKPIDTFDMQGCNQQQFILVVDNGSYTSPFTITCK